MRRDRRPHRRAEPSDVTVNICPIDTDADCQGALGDISALMEVRPSVRPNRVYEVFIAASATG